MWGTAAAAASLLTVSRTSSEPARARAATCRMVPSISAVSVFVIDCTTMVHRHHAHPAHQSCVSFSALNLSHTGLTRSLTRPGRRTWHLGFVPKHRPIRLQFRNSTVQ